MYKLPQETTALQHFLTNKIDQELGLAYSRRDGEVIQLTNEEGKEIVGCCMVTPKNKTIPVFHVPMLFNYQSESMLCVDMRAHMREARLGVNITNPTEYGFNVGLTKLTDLWRKGELKVVFNFCQEQLMRIWVRWIGTALITRLSIDETIQPAVNIITAWYFYCLCNPEETSIPEYKLTRITHLLSKTTFANSNTVVDIVTKLPFIDTLGGFIEALKEHSGTERFNSLTEGFIYSMLQYTWYGSAAVHITSSATECPPVFIAMCWASVRYSAFGKSPIGKTMRDLKSQESQLLMQTVEKSLVN